MQKSLGYVTLVTDINDISCHCGEGNYAIICACFAQLNCMVRRLVQPDLPDSASIGRSLRYVEWTMLAVAASVIAINGADYKAIAAFHVTFASLGVLALLSFSFPIARPLWQRRGYIFLEILVLLPTRIVSAWNLELFLYLMIAKSCFLLKRKDVAFIVIAMAIVWQLSLAWSFFWQLPETVALIRSRMADYSNNPAQILIAQIINDTGAYVASSTFVVLFSFVAIAERKSRQRAESLSQQVETLTATLERTRIARDIHDSLGHSLTNLDSQLALIHYQLEQHRVAEACQAVEMAQSLSSQCIEEVSRVLQTMRQSDFDLNGALLSLVEQLRQNQIVEVRWDINLPLLPLHASHHIYYIVKEGLTNIQKHAQASRIFLRCEYTPDAIILELEDNGRGFNIETTLSGFGLRGIKERVQILNGQLTINSTPDLGTRIYITIPR